MRQETVLTSLALMQVQRNQITVKKIDISGNNARRGSNIDTELGTQRFAQASIDESTHNQQTISEMHAKVNQSEQDQQAIVSMLRQSQSGHDLSPGKHLNTELHFIEAQDTQMQVQRNKTIMQTNKEIEGGLLQKNQADEKPVHAATPVPNGPSPPRSDENVTSDQQKTYNQKSHEKIQTEAKNKQVVEGTIMVNQEATEKSKSLLQGLSEQERLEIKQTMKLVYPNMALSKVANRNDGSKPSKISQKQSKRRRSREIGNTEPLENEVSKSKEGKKNGVARFEIGQRLSLDSSGHAMILSDHLSQRAFLESSQSRQNSYVRFSKKPQSNRGFLQHQQSNRYGSQNKTLNVFSDNTVLNNRILPGSQNLSRRMAQEILIKIFDLDQQKIKKRCTQEITADNFELNSSHSTDRSNKDSKNMSAELFLLDQFTSQKHNLKEQDAIIGQKKQIFQRQSAMSNKSASKRSKSPSNYNKRPAGSPTQTRESKPRLLGKTEAAVQVNSQQVLSDYENQKAKRGWTSYEEQREIAVQKKSFKQPVSTSGNSRASTKRMQNIVSSGEVSLVNTVASLQSARGDGKKIRVKQTRLNLKNVEKNNTNTLQETKNLKSHANGPLSPGSGKVHSQISESQLTNMSTDRYIRQPLLGSQLTFMKQQMQSNGQNRTQNRSPEIWKPNMRTIAEGETLRQKLKVYKKPTEALTMGLQPVVEDTLQVVNTEQSIMGSNKPGSQRKIAQKKFSYQEASSRPIISRGQQESKIVSGIQQQLKVQMQQEGHADVGTQQDSKQTNYLSIPSVMNEKQKQSCFQATSPSRKNSQELNFAQSSNSLNRDQTVGSKMQLSSVQHKKEVENFNEAVTDILKQEFIIQKSTPECMIECPLKITGQKMALSAVSIEKTQSNLQEPLHPDFSSNLLKIKVQSTSPPLFECKSGDDMHQNVSNNSPSTYKGYQKRSTHPHLLLMDDQRSIEGISPKFWGSNRNSKNLRMISPKVKIRGKKQKQDWNQINVSPVAMSFNKTQFKTLNTQSKQNSKQEIEKPRLRDYLLAETNELIKHKELGYVSLHHPGVRLINSEHIAELNYTKKFQQKSIGVLEGSNRTYRTMKLEQINESQNIADITILTSPTQARDLDSLNNTRDRGSAYGTQTTTHRQVSATSTNIGVKNKLASMERLNAFYNSANKYSKQPYVQPDCKYVLSSTGQSLQKNMAQLYGVQMPNSTQINVLNRRFGENHSFEFKRVPIQAKKDGCLMSDFASPKESVYARRKLILKERKEHALHVKNLNEHRHLEMSFNVSSPAARMKSLILTQQKKNNTSAKPTIGSNPVLYQHMELMKTWNTSPLH